MTCYRIALLFKGILVVKQRTVWKTNTISLIRFHFRLLKNSGYFMHHRPSDRSLPTKLVPTLADRGCRALSATDPHGRNLGFLHPEPLLFHSSSSSIILTRLSGIVRLRTKTREFFYMYHPIFAHESYLYIWHDSQNKQRWFPYTILTYWSFEMGIQYRNIT
jgi:hypothetical protein